MKRLTDATVFSGLVTAWFFAALPTDALAVLAETDNGRGGAVAFRVDDNRRARRPP